MKRTVSVYGEPTDCGEDVCVENPPCDRHEGCFDEHEDTDDYTGDDGWENFVYHEPLRERLQQFFGRLFLCVILRRHKPFTYRSITGHRCRGCQWCPRLEIFNLKGSQRWTTVEK